MLIVENSDNIKIFEKYWNAEPSLIIPIWSDLDKHPMNNTLSFLYIRFRDSETDQGDVPMDFIIPLNHNDCEIPNIDLSSSKQKKIVWNKKGILQTTLCLSNTLDLQSYHFFNTNELIDLQEITELLTNFYNKVGLRDNLGKSIPIMKFGQILRKFSNEYIEYLDHDIKDGWINSVMIPILSRLEQNGICVDVDKFNKKWPNNQKYLSFSKIYTEYNPYTTTSRPSNRHGGINFSSLNKTDGTREIFIPGLNHIFAQFDYDAYHVRLIAKMIDYDIPFDIHGHQWLADLYGTSYDEGKQRTFRILYGGPNKKDIQIPFFKEVDIYIQNLWKDVQVSGNLITPKGRKIKLEWIDSPTPQKVFNYLLQATETEYNIEIIKELFDNDINSMIFYTYDSFLFDLKNENVLEDGAKIKTILESNGFPVRGSWGKNYSEV